MPFLLNTTVATSTNIYSLSDSLSTLQTYDALFLAFAFAFVGLLLVEARTLAIIYRFVRRLFRRQSKSKSQSNRDIQELERESLQGQQIT